MNAKKFIVLLTVAFLLLLTISSVMYHDDFQDGWSSYVKKDFKTAHKLWLPLAEEGNVRAQFFIGYMYDIGFGVQEEDQEAVKWYRLAAEQGDTRAQFFMGFMLDFGYGVPEDDQEAVKWYRLAAEQGYAPANTIIYDLAEKGAPPALRILKADAEKGVAEAQKKLGVMYDLGFGVPEDNQKAVKWYRLATEQGVAPANTIIYDLAEKGAPPALRVLKADAEKGVARAQFRLGLMYDFGSGVPEDDQEAVKWYRLAAEQGVPQANKIIYLRDALAQHLGRIGDNFILLNLTKKYTPIDLRVFMNDAEKGVAREQFRLGLMYDLGFGVPEDNQKAVKWYRLAAKQGVAQAQSKLGVMYDFGYGVQKDNKEAFKWYRLAAEQRSLSR